MFFKNKKSKDNIRELYRLDLNLDFENKIYVSSAVLERVMQIMYDFGAKVVSSQSFISHMEITLNCTYTEMQVLISELRKDFPKIGIKNFSKV